MSIAQRLRRWRLARRMAKGLPVERLTLIRWYCYPDHFGAPKS